MAPVLNLPVRPKPPSNPMKQDGRITKATKRGKSTTKGSQEPVSRTNEDLAAMTLKVMNLQLANDRVLPNDEQPESLIKTVAATILDPTRRSKPAPDKPRRQRRTKEPESACLVMSDSAGDALAAHLERMDFVTVSPAHHIHFYKYLENLPIADPLVVRSSDTKTLIDLTTTLLRRRRLFFRESDHTKQPPVEWTFIVSHRYLKPPVDPSQRYRTVVHEQYSETCTVCFWNFDNRVWGNPDESYPRFLAALGNQNALRKLIDDVKAGRGRDGAEAHREEEPGAIDSLFDEEEEQLYGVVKVYFR